jgi:predicted ATPase/DNA-binding CsgD family transcriptional regulator
LIGREREAAAVQALLLDGPRCLVTLTGPGGVGKTRLAHRVAATLTDHLAGGVAAVPLDDVPTSALLLPAIIRSLGLDPDPPHASEATWLDRLADALRDRQMLLVLDGFERLAGAATDLSELLARCPGLRLLVTSRVRLRLADEQEFPVPPLALPADDASEADVLGTPAVAMFVERTRALRPGLRLDGEVATVAAICRRLDGLPLAIELAAPRLAHLGPRALLERLGSRLPLLTGGARDVPARHRTMRDAIAWSVDLLAPSERDLFARLGVFAGSFTLEAAEFVGGEGAPVDRGSSTPAVLDSLGALIDANLVRLLPGKVAGQERYGLLDTVREYAAELLATLPDADHVRARLHAWLVDLSERAWWPLVTPERGTWLERLAAEDPNVHATLAWALGRDDAATVLGLIVGSVYYRWNTQGLLATEGHWLDRALDLAAGRSAEIDPLLHGRALTHAGMSAFQTGDVDRARQSAEAAVAVLRRAGDQRHLSTAQTLLASILSMRGDYEPARQLCLEVAAFRRAQGPLPRLVAPLINLGNISTSQGLLDAGRAELEEALALADLHEDERDRAFTRCYLGENAALAGRLDEARPLLDGARARLGDLKDVRGAAYATTWLAFAERRQGDLRAAADLVAEALLAVQQIGDRPVAAPLLDVLAGILVDTERAEEAARILGAATGVRDEMRVGVRPVDRRWRDSIQTVARAALGVGRFARAEEAGRRLGLAKSLVEAADLVAQVAERLGSAPLVAPATAGADHDPASLAAVRGLSRRELEVLRLLVEGCSDREVGERLSISPHTASKHVARILGKLEVPTRAAAAAVAVRASVA